MNTLVENYFIDGCGRCPLGGTEDCKVRHWQTELKQLRRIILDCGLEEECKWGAPCYTFQSKNVLMLSALKHYCCISFFKGALLNDEENLLVKPGPNSHASRLFKFTSPDEIYAVEAQIKTYLFEAIENEKLGLKVEPRKEIDPWPRELINIFENDPMLKSAFESLTPGRQRGYILHFSQAKKLETRILRIEKSIPLILSGIGFHEQYKFKG